MSNNKLNNYPKTKDFKQHERPRTQPKNEKQLPSSRKNHKRMVEFNKKQVIDYFHRSYTAVDGLWFLKVEEKYGFDRALEIDGNVWKIMPKIQARMIKSMLGVNEGVDALLQCLTAKFTLEGFDFKTQKVKNGFRVIVKDCPWHELMIKSGRSELSAAVGTAICGTEYSVWASEFDDRINFTLKAQKCKDSKCCMLVFET